MASAGTWTTSLSLCVIELGLGYVLCWNFGYVSGEPCLTLVIVMELGIDCACFNITLFNFGYCAGTWT